MPITISLFDVVCRPNLRSFWPQEFDQLVREAQKKPDERTIFGAIADWLDAADEGRLARGFRYLCSRPGITVYHKDRKWNAYGFPSCVDNEIINEENVDYSTLAGLVATVVLRLEKAEVRIKKYTEELK